MIIVVSDLQATPAQLLRFLDVSVLVVALLLVYRYDDLAETLDQ